MASFTKCNDFTEDVGNGVHDLSADQLMVALSNTAPGSETSDPTADGNGVLSNVTEISYTNLSGATPRNLSSTWTLSSGTATLSILDLTLSASGGDVGPFQYVYVYNDTATNDELISVHDRGQSTTILDGEDLTLDFDDANGLLDLS